MTAAHAALVVLAAATIAGCATKPPSRAVATPTVTGGTHGDGYSRAQFGPAWEDVDGNGCDTRNDELAEHVTDDVLATDGCTVLSGTLIDPYTGATIAFRRGNPQPVQIDHVVSLHTAWHRGASDSEWTPERRLTFANDPSNLLPTTLNGTKGDRTPAQLLKARTDPLDKWKPSDAGECLYARTYTLSAVEWGLDISDDRDALATMLTRCPGR